MATKNQQIVDIDTYLDSNEIIAQEIPVELDVKEKKVKRPKNETLKDKFNLPTTSVALSQHARKKLESYLKKTSQYKILDEQIKLLLEEYGNYKTLGNNELMTKTSEIIIDLSDKKKKFVKLYKNINTPKDEKEKSEISEKLKTSEKLNELKDSLKNLETEFNNYNTNSLAYKIYEYRKMLNILNLKDEEQNFIDDDDEPVEFDTFIEEKTNGVTKQEYINLCGHIADIVDLTPGEIMKMPTNEIKKLLKTYSPDLTKVREAIYRKKIEINNESNKIKGNEDITEIIFNIFDLDTVPESQPKEMLAAANISYVKALAYNTCNKLSMLHYFDDAVAYGLVGLTVAINRWYKIQKFEDTVISFNGFASIDILGSIKKGLYELNTGGRISGSVMATIEHKRNKQIKAYLENNPELKDVPRELLDNLLDGVIDDKVEAPITESQYSSIVGGEESSNNADIWANIAKYEDEKMLMGKLDLINSLKALFGLFQNQTSSESGAKKIFEKPIFDKYDYKLFKLLFGFEYKKETLGDGKSTKNTNYNQDEIGQIMVDYYKANGIEKTFTQSAISTRVKSLMERLKECVEKYPVIKSSLQFIAINSASNNLDSVFDEFEKEKYINDQKTDSQTFNNDLSSKSLKLSEVFDETSENPLDDEIANYFENFDGLDY